MFCDKCGKKLAPGSIFCPNCGAKLPEDKTAPKEPEGKSQPIQQEMPAVEPAPAPETPPEPPKTKEEPVPSPAPQSTPTNNDAAYRTIIAKNADYYLPQFQDIAHGGKGKLNWASFLLTLYHAAYRGVWREWLRAVMWPLILDAVCALLACALIGSHPGAALVFVLVAACGGIWWIVANILFAKRFNRIYKAHVEQKIAQQNITPDPSSKRVVWSVLAYFAVYIVASMIVGALSVGSLMAGVDDTPDSDYSAADSIPESDNSADADTTAEIPRVSDTAQSSASPEDFCGSWRVDRLYDTPENLACQIINQNGQYFIYAGTAQNPIIYAQIDWNSANSQATGHYKCSGYGTNPQSFDGEIIVEIEDNELYLTLTDYYCEVKHEHCTREPDDVLGTLTDGVIRSIEQRLYDEAAFAFSIQGQIMNRENWRSYEEALLDTVADRNDYSGLSVAGTFAGTDSQTGVSMYRITQDQMEQWMKENYGADISYAQPDTSLYAKGYYTAYGSQGFIGDTVSLLTAYDLQNDTYYVQFSKQNEASSDDDGYGYAVVHFSDEYSIWQVWELGWDYQEISEQALDAYIN